MSLVLMQMLLLVGSVTAAVAVAANGVDARADERALNFFRAPAARHFSRSGARMSDAYDVVYESVSLCPCVPLL